VTPPAPSRDLARHKEKLLALRAEILSEGDIEIEPGRKDPTEIGTDDDEAPLTEMNQVIASKRNRVRADALAKIQVALKRLEEEPELFGLCAECEEPIGRRLELMPYVELCVECQGARDDAPKDMRRRHLTDYK
jgi:DnaK suppressor protein